MNWKKIDTSYIKLAVVLVVGVAVIAAAILLGPDLIESTVSDQNTAPPTEAVQTEDVIPVPTESAAAGNSSTPPAVTDSQESPLPTDDPTTTYTVENERFGIDYTGKNARETTDGINKALEWAKAQGYSTIHFAEGTYLIQCKWGDRFKAPTDGILVPSDLTLDLSGCTFVMETNSDPEYAIFGIVNQSNVTIKNGTLIGDMDKHIYTPSQSSPTHEYGFGICISASSNVLIQGVAIRNMTGDGIIIEGSYTVMADGGRVSSDVRILDCDISDCRRQGISVVGADNCEIARNKIYDIAGVASEYGIMVMSQLDYTIDKLDIHDNNIYNCAGGAIACNTGNNCEVYSNTCAGNILVVFASNTAIHGNFIEDSFIEVMPGASNITVEDNILDGNSFIKLDESQQ